MVFKMPIRGPNLFFKYFFSILGLAYFTPLGCLLRFNFFGSLVGPLTLLHPKMKLLQWRDPRDLETMGIAAIPFLCAKGSVVLLPTVKKIEAKGIK